MLPGRRPRRPIPHRIYLNPVTRIYADGKFFDAAQKIPGGEPIRGLKIGLLDYDLGNAYYRSGQLGKAILHYERAFRLNSGQGDVLYNLNFATTKAGDPEMPAGALPALVWQLFYILSINALTLFASFLFIFMVGAAASALAGKNFLNKDLPSWV